MKINYLLEITRNGEHANTFTGDGEKALVEMVKTLSYIQQQKRFYNVVKTKITSDSVKNTVKAMIQYDNGFKYEYVFSGEDLNKVWYL